MDTRRWHCGRRELPGAADATVAIFPSREDSIPFLEENTVWEFIRIGQNPKYAGMYITGAVGAVMSVARITEIVPASEPPVSRSLESSTGDQAPFDQNKRVGIRAWYTDLESFRTAEPTDGIL